jgi:hypothetical protein
VEALNALAVKTVTAAGVTDIHDAYTAVTNVCGSLYYNCTLCDNEAVDFAATCPSYVGGCRAPRSRIRVMHALTPTYLHRHTHARAHARTPGHTGTHTHTHTQTRTAGPHARAYRALTREHGLLRLSHVWAGRHVNARACVSLLRACVR